MIPIPFNSLAMLGPSLILVVAIVIAILFFAPGLLAPIGRILGLTIGFSLRKKRVLSGNTQAAKEQRSKSKPTSEGIEGTKMPDTLPNYQVLPRRRGVPVLGIVLLAVGVVTMLLWYLMHTN